MYNILDTIPLHNSNLWCNYIWTYKQNNKNSANQTFMQNKLKKKIKKSKKKKKKKKSNLHESCMGQRINHRHHTALFVMGITGYIERKIHTSVSYIYESDT